MLDTAPGRGRLLILTLFAAERPPRLPEPLVVTRWVSVRGSIMIRGQKIQVGLVHARKTVQVSVGPDTYQIAVEPGITVTAPRTSSRDIRRHKASNYDRHPAVPEDLLTVRATGCRL